MKKLFFLLLFPAFAMAQYQGNANQKITLGEQTTADGLVFRGRASIDTVTATSKITRANKQDTSTFILLDTVTNLLWHYKTASNGWIQAGGSTFDTTTLNLVSRFGLKLNISDTASMLTNYYRSGSALGTPSSVTAGGKFEASFSNTSTTFDNNSYLRLVNTGASTLNQRVDLIMRWADGTYNGTGGISMVRESATGKSGKLILQPIASDGNNIQALTLLGTGAATFSSSVTAQTNLGFINTNASQAGFVADYTGTGAVKVSMSTYNDIFQVFNETNGYSIFNFKPSTKAFVINPTGGNVGIGTTSPQSGYRLHVVDSVYVGGNVSASAYTTRSDYDLKDEIQNISYGINEVMQMQPVKYTYKSNGSTQLGFIAQDLGVITPEVVSFEDKMSVYYNALIPILTKAIQEQNALIKALEQRLLILENK